jgi:hypothetical protein
MSYFELICISDEEYSSIKGLLNVIFINCLIMLLQVISYGETIKDNLFEGNS